jgi:large subunit ribosomal protein L18
MNKFQIKTEKRERRKKRIKARLFGDAQKPRLAVFKSNTAISAQIINDLSGVTLASSHSKLVSGKNLQEKSFNVGLDIAKKAKEKKIDKVKFDRGGFMYTGNIKNVALGAREGGLLF